MDGQTNVVRRVLKTPGMFLWKNRSNVRVHSNIFILSKLDVTWFEPIDCVYPLPRYSHWRSHGPTSSAPARFFQRWAMTGSEGRKSSSRVQLQLPGGGLGAPKSWRHFLKMMHKYFVFCGFRQHLQQKHFVTFPRGQVSPLAHACGRPCPILHYAQMSINEIDIRGNMWD